MEKIALYGIFEIVIPDTNLRKQPQRKETEKEAASGEEALVRDCARFWQEGGNEEITISAFRKNREAFAVRFMPKRIGTWKYQISLFGETYEGSFFCGDADEGVHGMVMTRRDHFCYEDGEKYLPFGTTCYAWIHQEKELQEETLRTLERSCFNKIRMLVFPKFMPYNQEDPAVYPFEKGDDGHWDIRRIVDEFWENLDENMKRLMELGIEADLILFHPYDKWGFADMSQEDSLYYVEYMIARYSACRNLWWSLANEYEMLRKKTIADWDEYGELLAKKDPYHHLISVHNILVMYPKRSWMTHVSVQSGDVQRVGLWRQQYQLPVIDDEFGYEGNLEYDWGNLSAFEFVDRCWKVVCRGGFVTHGETFHREDEVLWWSKGGRLYGQAQARIAFLKDLLYELPGNGEGLFSWYQDPNREKTDERAGEEGDEQTYFSHLVERTPEENKGGLIAMQPMILAAEQWRLRYFGRTCPYIMREELPEGSWKAELINVWEMTREQIACGLSGNTELRLPAKEGMAVLMIREGGNLR